jgi:hypothetical protein
MGLFAMAINTGSTEQDGGTAIPGLRFNAISSSLMVELSGYEAPQWYDYRPLAKGILGEELNIFLLVSNTDVVIDPNNSGNAIFWEEVAFLETPISGTLGLPSQRPYYLPRYRGTDTNILSATASTSSWQWVDGLDKTIASYNESNIGNEYYPGNYGWILGVTKSGTPNGWNVQAWFWGTPGDPVPDRGQSSFISVLNSLPTGSSQPAQANVRTYGPTDGNTALANTFYSSWFKISPNNGEVANYVAIYNKGSVLNDVGKAGFLDIITGPSPFFP